MFTGLYKQEDSQDNGKWNSKQGNNNNNNTSFLKSSSLTAVSLTQTVLALSSSEMWLVFSSDGGITSKVLRM